MQTGNTRLILGKKPRDAERQRATAECLRSQGYAVTESCTLAGAYIVDTNAPLRIALTAKRQARSTAAT